MIAAHTHAEQKAEIAWGKALTFTPFFIGFHLFKHTVCLTLRSSYSARRASCHVVWVCVRVVRRWNDVAYVRPGPMQCLVLVATCRRTRYPNLHYLQHRHVWHDTLNLFYALTGRSGMPSSTELVWCMHSFYEVDLCLVEGVRGIRELVRDEGASLID
jgi:hypothetical protein